MKSIHAAIFVVWLAAVSALHASAAPVPAVKPIAFKYDFEDGRALDIKPLMANGKFKVDFMGITAEKAFTGSNSFKFEVSVESGNYFRWIIPFKTTAEGRLNLSCRYQVATTAKGTFGPGVSLGYPAISSANGVDFFTWVNSTDGGWTWLMIDLAAFAKSRITRAGHAFSALEIQPSRVAGSVDGLVICFNGMTSGERMTLYLDDLAVEGETQELTEDFNRRAIDLWRPVREKHLAAIQKMQGTISNDCRFLSAYTNLSSAAELFQQVARTNLADWGVIAQSAAKRGYLLEKEVVTAGRHDERINDLMANVAMLDGYDFQKPASGDKKIHPGFALFAVMVLLLLLLMRRGRKRQAVDHA